ncbi:MAG: hypothetical protein ACK41Y_16875, partial [Paracoccus hibiscisoli]|uniref:hypothetical protein n=1 Tax=Paracoccus hibiscisoli TaxID=2023261 RepID=UPI00391B5DA8
SVSTPRMPAPLDCGQQPAGRAMRLPLPLLLLPLPPSLLLLLLLLLLLQVLLQLAQPALVSPVFPPAQALGAARCGSVMVHHLAR